MKDRNQEFWEDGSDYNDYVCREFNDGRKDLWQKQLLKHLPKDKNIKVLDVGCGPGFFSCILSECGYDVTGLDRSEDMLRHAALNAQEMHVSPRFINMDASSLCFDDELFNAVVSRNVTWTFKNPKESYIQFYKKLNSGGELIIYDANWHIPFYEPDLMKKVRDNEKWYLEKFQHEFKVYDDDRTIFEDLPLSDVWRPQWDLEILKEIGFKTVEINENVGQDVYLDWEKRLYSATPMFEILAVK